MNNRWIWIIGLCLLPHCLMSMQQDLIIINQACELKTLALTVRPEEYEKKLEEYNIRPNAVVASTSILLGSDYVPDGTISHINRMKENNPAKYKKLIIQIMHAYSAKRYNGNALTIAEAVQTDMYTKLVQDIGDGESAIKNLKDGVRDHCFYMSIPGTFLGFFAIIDIMLLARFLACG